MQLIFATNNRHKLNEITAVTGNDYQIKGLAEMNISEEIPETHDTLEGNAIEKATYIYNKYGYNCFADDTGLEIEALNGRPGVYSARFAGENCSFKDNMDKVLKEMKGIKNRKAQFRTIIAIITDGKVNTFEGEVKGSIIEMPRGKDGFGYDPIFLPDDFDETFAEMSLDLKNTISHRARAMEKFIAFLKTHKY